MSEFRCRACNEVFPRFEYLTPDGKLHEDSLKWHWKLNPDCSLDVRAARNLMKRPLAVGEEPWEDIGKVNDW